MTIHRMRSISLAALVLLACLALLPACGHDERPLADTLPRQAGPFQLTQLLTGPEAQAAVDKLHGRPIRAKDAALARYTLRLDDGATGTAEVWATRHDSAAEAREQAAVMLDKMLRAIRDGGSPMSDPQTLRIAGQDVYLFLGLDAEHYVASQGDRVLWITAPAGTGQPLVEAVLGAK